MRNWRCWGRSHQWEPVGFKDVWMVPTMGLQIVMKPDPDGDHEGCQRCGTVQRKGKNDGAA